MFISCGIVLVILPCFILTSIFCTPEPVIVPKLTFFAPTFEDLPFTVVLPFTRTVIVTSFELSTVVLVVLFVLFVLLEFPIDGTSSNIRFIVFLCSSNLLTLTSISVPSATSSPVSILCERTFPFSLSVSH